MHKLAFRMQLLEGKESEYKKRHDEIWPELSALLKVNGINEYSIFLDRSNGNLFASLKISRPADIDLLAANTIMQRWWAYMADIMETNPDKSPKTIVLEEVFYLP